MGLGRGSAGRLGDGTNTQRTAPVQIGTGTNWRSVAAGWLHSVAVRTDGTLWAWGLTTSGRSGPVLAAATARFTLRCNWARPQPGRASAPAATTA
ncbi:hypothetical protein ACFQT0_31320 [Hymenobacter humi]|uniref:Chromosome condensation regulator RCC1 n=1 Tax=Hymenobacter humi TaxID=1411620 RepID=A0ABW2UDA2_9BACT